MVTEIIQIKIRMPWVHSLKEKRMVVKSICAKTRNKFNVSIAEIDDQDIHQIAVLGIAFVAAHPAQADSFSEHLLNFIEGQTEGEIISIEQDRI